MPVLECWLTQPSPICLPDLCLQDWCFLGQCLRACVYECWGAEDRGLLTVRRLGGPREVELGWVAVAGDDDWLFHHIDAVALHQILKEVEDFLSPGALECKYS